MCMNFLDYWYRLFYGKHRRNGSDESDSEADLLDENAGYLSFDDTKVQCDLFRQKNTERHHTDEYENASLVLRRGDTFSLGMKFEGISLHPRVLDIANVKLRLNMECKHLKSKKINVATIGVEDDSNYFNKETWGMTVVEKDLEKSNIVVKVMIPVTAAIGRYNVDVVLPSASSFILLHKFDIIVLFNAWNKDDDVYLDSEELREEYVLNDTGLIYRGSASNGIQGITATPWNFGQFEENVLDCVLLLLKKDKRLERQPLKSHRKQNSAVWIGRVLSAVLNCQQDKGLLEGNWSGKYEKGKAPSSWLGSADIFQQYYKTKQQVKYGQCWVFSGVMTTALRALGIPGRCVTNFDSAHDTDESMTIDVIHSEDGARMDDISDDSIWNFHVWNEMWTRRNDLPSKNCDGWNVVDATPQEESNQLHQAGPAPVNAIKNGEIYNGYDTGFVFAEVNADYVKWIAFKDTSGSTVFEEASFRHKTYIGKYISTKMVGKDEREDITSLYKYPEGSEEERTAFQNAYKFGQGPELRKGLLHKTKDDEKFEVDLIMKPGTMIPNGTDFTCKVQIRNTSNQTSRVNITVVVNTMEYTGRSKALVKTQKFENRVVRAGENIEEDIVISADEYVKKLSDLNFMKIVALMKVSETKKQYVEDCKIQLYHQDCIGIKFLDPVKAGSPTRVEISFTNKLKIKMTNLTYSVNGKGLTRTITTERRSLGVGERETIVLRIIPFKAGKHRLDVDIDSAEVKDLRSSLEVEVQ